MSERTKRDPDVLRPRDETPQPPPRRVRVHARPRGHRPPAGTVEVTGSQRFADHRRHVAAAQQRDGGQQHVGHQAGPTTRPPGTHAALPRPFSKDSPPGKPPRAQPTPAPRTRDPAPGQVAFDPTRVGPYHQHRCLAPTQEGPSPTRPKKEGRVLSRPGRRDAARLSQRPASRRPRLHTDPETRSAPTSFQATQRSEPVALNRPSVGSRDSRRLSEDTERSGGPQRPLTSPTGGRTSTDKGPAGQMSAAAHLRLGFAGWAGGRTRTVPGSTPTRGSTTTTPARYRTRRGCHAARTCTLVNTCESDRPPALEGVSSTASWATRVEDLTPARRRRGYPVPIHDG
jgi:hypothetical protein